MKIQSLETYIVDNPWPHHGGRYLIFLKLTTDTGISGIGEVYTATFSPAVVQHMIEDVFEHHVQDSNPLRCRKFRFEQANHTSGITHLKPDSCWLPLAGF